MGSGNLIETSFVSLFFLRSKRSNWTKGKAEAMPKTSAIRRETGTLSIRATKTAIIDAKSSKPNQSPSTRDKTTTTATTLTAGPWTSTEWPWDWETWAEVGWEETGSEEEMVIMEEVTLDLVGNYFSAVVNDVGIPDGRECIPDGQE